MKPKSKIVFGKWTLMCVIFIFSLFFSENGVLLAQDIEPNKPLDVKLEVIDFNKSLNTFDLVAQIQANSNLIDFKTEILCASFVELIDNEGNEIKSYSVQQKNRLKFKYEIHKNTSFKIKAVFTGVQLPDSINFTQIEYYYFLFNGDEFETFSDPSNYSMLKSKTTKDDLSVFNRVEVEDIKIGKSNGSNLKSATQESSYTFNISGKIGYRDNKNDWHPVRYAKIEVWDKDFLSSTILGGCATDQYGNYTIDITSNEEDGPDIYIKVFTDGIEIPPTGSNETAKEIAVVKEKLSIYPYYADSKDNIEENTTSNLTISFTIPNIGADAGCFYVYDSFVVGWLNAKENFHKAIDKVVVYWPEGDDFKAANYETAYIAIGQSLGYDRDVHLHEYGHYIDRIIGLTNMKGGKHNIENLTGTKYTDNVTNEIIIRSRNEAVRTALGEGWATFFAVASQYSITNNDNKWDLYTETLTPAFLPLEDVPSIEFGYPNVQDADHELAVSGILWDIFDETNEQDDNLSEGLTEVYRVLSYGGRIDSIQQFADRWQSLKKVNLSALLKIYSHFGIKSDLIPIDQSLSSYQAKAGSTLMAYCSEKNLGSLLAGANVISIHLSADELFTPDKNGDRFIDEINIPVVPANATTNSFSKSITIPLDVSPGSYYLFFSADGGEAIDENDEDNNFASVILTIGPSVFTHDYAVKSLTVSNKNPTVGENVLVSAIIRNEGTVAEADNQVVKLYENGDLINTYSSFSSLIAGGERIQTFNWTAKAGVHELKAEIVLSGDENSANNTKTIKTYTGSSGNLLISGDENQEIEVTSYSGSTNLFSLQLQNTGADDISATISTTGDRESWISQIGGNSISILSGQSKIYSISITVPAGTSSGSYSTGIEFNYADGTRTSAINITIVVIESAKGLVAFEYWFDDMFESRKYNNINSQNLLELNSSLSTTGLSNGLHSFHLRVLDKKGYWSSIVSEFFHKLPSTTGDLREITTCEYWFDDDYASKISDEIIPGQTITTNEGFDVNSLTNGLHSYHVRYKDDAGQWSSVVSEFFHKLPVSAAQNNLITAYRYWFNRDEENIQFINIDTPVNPYELIRDISVSGLPSGDNTIHFQFKDTRHAWSSVVTDTFNMEGLLVQEIALKTGWNIFSVGLEPQNSEINSVSQKLITNSSLVKIQDEGGNSFEDWGIFGGWQNNIGNILLTEGYKIKVNRNDTLEISGFPVEYPYAIPLKAGWNIAGYPLQTDFSGMNLVQQLADKGTLIKVQDEGGNSIEDWGIFGSWQNNIGNFMAGEGYKIKVSADDTLWIYESYPKSSAFLPEIVATSHFAPVFKGNGMDHMNINLVGLPINILQAGDELAIFDGATCVGAVTLMPHHLRNQTASIVASATDNQGMPGFFEGNPFVLKLCNAKSLQEFKLEPEIVKGTSTFIRNESTVASLEKYATTGLDGLIASEQPEINCYPNPFSEEITVEINLINDTDVYVEVLNQLGQQVKYLAAGEQLNRGVNRLIWDGTNAGKSRVAPGIYLIRMKINDVIYYRKVVYSE